MVARAHVPKMVGLWSVSSDHAKDSVESIHKRRASVGLRDNGVSGHRPGHSVMHHVAVKAEQHDRHFGDSWHREVKESQVRLTFLCHLDSLYTVSGLSADLVFGLGFENSANRLPHAFIVVSNKNSVAHSGEHTTNGLD